jgi:hypothetical protein
MSGFTITLILLGLVVLLLAIYYLYNFIYVSPQSKNAIILLKKETLFDEDYLNTIQLSNMITNRSTLLIPDNGYGLSFSWDMYIPNIAGSNGWQNKYNIVKPIITMNDSPQIGYNPKRNFLSVTLRYRNNPFYAQFAEIRLDDIKQQTWNNYILVIHDRLVNLYVNGELLVSKFLPSIPVLYDINSNIILGQKNNNFQGKIKNLILYPLPLSFSDIKQLQ